MTTLLNVSIRSVEGYYKRFRVHYYIDSLKPINSNIIISPSVTMSVSTYVLLDDIDTVRALAARIQEHSNCIVWAAIQTVGQIFPRTRLMKSHTPWGNRDTRNVVYYWL